MAENLQPARCSESEYSAARAAGLLIVSTADEVAVHKFAEAIRQSTINAELLEALRALEAMAERYRPQGCPIPDAQKKARAAIAKATGQAA